MTFSVYHKQIAVIGGGPGGLTLARLLQKQGVRVTVYERDASRTVRVQGATLDLHEESGLAALRKAGLMDAFIAHYRPGADKLRIVDKNAIIFFDDEEKETTETFGSQSFRPEIDRGPLREILLNSLTENTVVWDSQFVSLSPEKEGWLIKFKNGNTAYADVVIAADGANSKLRSYLTTIKPFYAGITMVEGAVSNSEKNAPRIHKLLNGGKIFALADGKSLIVSSKGDGSLVFYASWKEDEHWVLNSGIDFTKKEEVTAWFQKEFAGWDSLWLDLFDAAELPFIPRPQYCMPLDQHWPSLPNLTLLGDAAHLMPPFAGEGVNMAMLDALELSECLTSSVFSDVGAAIVAYEKQMLARSSAVAADTLAQTASIHSADGLSNMLSLFQNNESL